MFNSNLISLIFVYLVIDIHFNTFNYTTSKYATALKPNLDMSYRRNVTNLFFIAESPILEKYKHALRRYATTSNFNTQIEKYNKLIYSFNPSFKNKFCYSPDELGKFLYNLGCFFTLCAAKNGDLNSLKLLKKIGESPYSFKYFHYNFKQLLSELINKFECKTEEKEPLLLNLRGSQDINNINSLDKDFLHKIWETHYNNGKDQEQSAKDIADTLPSINRISIEECITSETTEESDYIKHYLWIPYLKFRSLTNFGQSDYINNTIKSHLLSENVEVTKNLGVEATFSDGTALSSSLGLLCVEELIPIQTSFSIYDYRTWYNALYNLFDFKKSKKFKVSIVANYSIPNIKQLFESVHIPAFDRLWHNIRHSTVSSGHSIESLSDFLRDNTHFYSSIPIDYTFWWTNPSTCVNYLLNNPYIGLDKSLLLEKHLDKTNLSVEDTKKLSEYFNSIIKNTDFSEYSEIRNKNEFEPAIGYVCRDSGEKTNNAPDIDLDESISDLIKNIYRNHLFVKSKDGENLRLVNNLMYKHGIVSNKRAIKDGLRILTIDGGGVRGLIPLMILKAILEEIGGVSLHEIFDIFGATSSGSVILSFLLFHKFTIDDTMDLFSNLMHKVFSKNKWGMVPDVVRYLTSKAKFDHTIFESYAKMMFGDLKMYEFNSDPRTPHVFFTATQTVPWPPKPIIFRSYPLTQDGATDLNSNLKEVRDFNIWEAVRCSTAAPSYFEEFKKDDKSYSDGALLTNNPSLEAINEAKMLYPDTPIKCLVSIGTGKFKNREDKVSNDTQQPKPANSDLLELLAYASTDVEHIHRYSQMILGEDKYFRFDPIIPKVSLDEINTTALDEMVRYIKLYLSDSNIKRMIKQIAKTLPSGRDSRAPPVRA